MRSRRSSKFHSNDISKDNILGSSRKPSPPKIYTNSPNINQMTQESSFQRKGRSTPKDCLGLVNPYQQKLLLPNRDTSKMSNKSGRSNFESESPNLMIQQKQEENMEIECQSPIKQYSGLKYSFFSNSGTSKNQPTRRVIKDASLNNSQLKQKESQDILKTSQRANKLRKANYHQQQDGDSQCQVYEFNRELKALRVKRTESFEWLQEESQVSEESQFNQFNQINLGIYYMDNLRNYLKGLNLEGLYAQMYINHFVQQFHSLQLSKQMQQPDQNKLEAKMLQLQKMKNQKTLVLDLDETLMHCNEQQQMKYDFKIPIQMPNGQVHEAGISVRPFAQQFLQECSKHFEIIIFTASHQLYADQIIDKLDPSRKWVSHRLYRENCIQTSQGIYVKDLRIINRDLKDIVLIDNAAYSYAFQIENGIPIIPYIDNTKDIELLGVIDYLKILLQINDVREINVKTFLLNKIRQCASLDEAIKLLLVA
ncbi:unnamed protein product [Paramecium pentaurelia]|uniref:FCP1 homology domain-containing protein n=1 Tax=Paramecium pentaurelia TaxID=43138 RepID=A0A8S1YAF0_9CILI|nr:unnamed protein product [Paramecium pentaurelia]